MFDVFYVSDGAGVILCVFMGVVCTSTALHLFFRIWLNNSFLYVGC